ncbi:MAG TPA: methyltransferase domain-containing protein [Burkholderiales bacterium]|nr:methyltransferase domain-containing protein [Burkholderiales bacterium]
MGLHQTYRLFAPVYDLAIRRASARARAASLARLPARAGARVLVTGIGTGLDVPHLPPGNWYAGIDLTAAMLARVPRRADLALVRGDAMRLPFADGAFDFVVMHLIVAVVPDPARCLAEAARVLRPGGRALVLDKFLRSGQRAPVRRALNAISRHVATRLDVVFEDALAAAPSLVVESDAPALVGGWFRSIALVKTGATTSSSSTRR